MARFGDFDQYLDNAGDPLAEGKLYFYESGTTTPKTTFADINNSIPNTNPVLLSAAGRQPNIFFDGVAKVILTDNNDVQLIVRDPVGETATDFGDEWVATKIYNAVDVVLGSDGVYYRSLLNGNQNNNPVTSTGYWTLLYSVEWNQATTYQVGALVTYDGEQYQSLQSSNLNQNPSTASSYWVLLSFAWLATATYAADQNAVGTDGILYTSLQNGNIGNDPATSPAYWVGTSAAAAASATAAAASAAAALVSENAAATSETNAAASETAAATSATNSANSATASASSATASAASASAAATSETNAATSASNSATSASQSATSATESANSATAALASETAAAASETAAAASESAAATSATNAATSATASATSATNSATSAAASASSATDSANSATASAGSATAAATSASNAATSATASANSATASAASATAAASSYDQFDDRYLGDKASDPTLDNDGNALLTGALYFNTTTDVMRVYTGSAWQDVAISTNSPTFTGTVTADAVIVNTDSGITLKDVGDSRTLTFKIDAGTGRYQASGSSDHFFTTTDSNLARFYIANNGDISFYEDTGTTPKFFWDASAERLGIGNSNPSAAYVTAPNLLIGDTSDTYSGISLFASSTGSSRILFGDAELNRIGQITYSHSDNSLVTTVNSIQAMTIDSSGNVGIGTGSPSPSDGTGLALHLSDVANNPEIRIQRTNTFTADYSIRAGGASIGRLRFKNNDSTNDVMTFYGDNVGIGTTSANTNLEVSDNVNATIRISSTKNDASWNVETDAYGKLEWYSADTSGNASVRAAIWATPTNTIGANSNLSFYTKGVTSSYPTERLRIDSSGNVGIGTDSPAAPLSIAGSSTGEYDALILRNSNAATSGQSAAIIFEASAGTSGDVAASVAKISGLRTGSGSTGDLLFHTTNLGISSERLRIDASGNVGIGTSSPASLLDIQGVGGATTSPVATATTGTNYIGWKSANTGGSFWTAIDNSTGSAFSSGTAYARVLWSNGAYPMLFSTNSTERMRIDASGNLLVGKTVQGIATSGVELTPNDRSAFTKSGGAPILVNRTSNDGEIINLRKDGTTVGSIGVEGGDSLYIVSGDTGFRFASGVDSIIPANANGGVRDAAIDIGFSSQRFKDLYLSNAAYINGITVGRGGGAVATNTAVGSSALEFNTSGAGIVANGYQALRLNTTGNNGVANGYQALYYNTTGTNNVATGYRALFNNTTASDNSAYGYAALYANTTGTNNTAVGKEALYVNTTGINNTALGYVALQSNTTGNNNIGIGVLALSSNTTGVSNVAIGRDSLLSSTTGNGNTAVGTNSGYLISTGAKNTIIGAYSGNQGGLDIRTSNNNIVLSDGDGNPRTHWDSNGAQYGPRAHYSGFITAEITNSHVGNDASGTADITFTLNLVNTSGTHDNWQVMLYLTTSGNSNPAKTSVYEIRGSQRNSAVTVNRTTLVSGESRTITSSTSGLTVTFTIASEGSSTATQGGKCCFVGGSYGISSLAAGNS